MKLLKRMKKALVVATITAMITSTAVTTMASDYDNHWAKNAIAEWVTYGVVGGYEDGTFKPGNKVTKAELASFITRVFGLTDKKTATIYLDVEDTAWYKDAVTKVTAAGIMTGTDGKFSPNAPATREEAAAALAAAYSLTETGSNTFKDADAISDWAKDGVLALAAGGYISGRPNGNFDPKATLTRAEFISMLDKVTEVFANKAGTYTGAQDGNVLVNTTDVILKDMTVSDNLYLAQGIGTGDVSLENVTVDGETIIAGGGINSIKVKDSVLKKGAKIVAKQAVRVVSEGTSSLSIVAAEGTTVVLTGNFDNVQVPAGVKVELKGATVASITVIPSVSNPEAKATIIADAASTIQKITADTAAEISGQGKIAELVVNVKGIKSEIAPTKTTVKEGVTASVGGKTVDSKGPVSSGGGGGGGGGGSTTSAIKVSQVVLYSGEKEVASKAVENNKIVLDVPSYKGSIDGIKLVLSNVAADQDITLVYDGEEQGFKANAIYSLGDLMEFGLDKQKDLREEAALAYMAVKKVTKQEAVEYVDAKIIDMQAKTGINLDEFYDFDGDLNIEATLEKIDKIYAKASTSQAALLDQLLGAVGIDVVTLGKEYKMDLTLKASGFNTTTVTLNIVR